MKTNALQRAVLKAAHFKLEKKADFHVDVCSVEDEWKRSCARWQAAVMGAEPFKMKTRRTEIHSH